MTTFTQPRTAQDPSALETQMAQATLDPRTAAAALPLMVGYGMERGANNATSQAYGNLVLQLQRQQAAAENSVNAGKMVNDFLKIVNENPGAVEAASSNPYLSPYLKGTDFSGAVQTANQNLTAKRLMEAGRGAGSMGMAGQFVDPGYLAGVIGPGANITQGTAPIVQAAAIRDGAGNKESVTMKVPLADTGEVTIKGPDVASVTARGSQVPNKLGSVLQSNTGNNTALATRAPTAQELAAIPQQVRAAAMQGRGKLEVYVASDGTKYLMGAGTTGYPIQ